MAETFAVKIAKEQAKLKRQATSATAAPRLQNASLDDTDLPMYDRDGQLKGTLGKQADGSFGVVPQNSPAQPTLTAPILPVPVEGDRVPNNFPVFWDGGVVQGVVPEVHGRTDVWFQMVADESLADPEQAKLGGSIRDRLGGATTIVVPGTGVVAVWFQMVGADRTTKGEFSAPSFVTVTARVDAQDIADRLDAFADGELPDGAYDNLMARLGEFLNVRADQIDVNSLAADTAFIALLETAGIILADEAGGRRTEVSGHGMQVFDTTTGSPLIQLGNFTGGDLVSLYDPETGDPTVTMTGAGGLSAVHLSSDEDPTFGGKPLMGDLDGSPQALGTSSVMDAVGRGASRVYIRSFAGPSAGSPRGIAHIEADVVPGRIYRISVPDFQMGDNQDYYMTGYYTTSADANSRPATPSSSSATLGTVPSRNPPSSGVPWASSSLSYEKIYTPSTARRIRILFVVARFSGGTITFGGANSIATNPRFLIEDLGPRVGDGGVGTWRDPSSTAALGAAPDLVTQPYPVFQTATYTLNLSTGVATSQGIDVEPRFGFWPNGVYYITLVQFESWNQGGSFYGLDINAVMGRWATASGQVIQSSVVNMTGTPPATFNYEAERTALAPVTGVGAGSLRRLPLGAGHAEAQAGRARASVLIGGTGWTAPHLNNSAAGILNRPKSFAQLSTTTSIND